MSTTPEPPVSLVVPADMSYVRLARLVVSSLAADLRFTFEQIEDLRIATDELLSALITSSVPGTPVHIGLTVTGTVIALRARALATGAVQLDPLAAQIVATTVATFSVSIDADHAIVELRSHAPEPAPVA